MVTQTLQSAIDIRKFVVDATSVPDSTVSSANAQGNFQTVASALQWVSYNNSFTNIVDIRGQFNLTADPGVNAINSVILSGSSSASELSFTTVLTLNNITFENLILNFSQEVSFGDNVYFNNCVISFGASGATKTSSINVIFDSCEIIFMTPFPLPTGTQINNSSITFDGSFTGPITLFGDNTINNCSFSGSINRFIVLDGNNINITYCNFISSNNPVLDGTYIPSDLVNTGNAVIYNNITISNINITNCNFSSSLLDRYPYISFEFNDSEIMPNVQDIIIRNNNFTQMNVNGDDIRAAIVFSSNITNIPTTFPFAPLLSNVIINGNICNYDQSILITSTRNKSNINGALLTTINVVISENICGTVGFITGYNNPANFTNNVNGAIQDKNGSLQIKSNSCKFIANIDNQGDFIPFIGSAFPTYNTTNYVLVATGPFTITDNSCNWIQVGTALILEPSEGSIISNNRLYAAVPGFLGNFTDAVSGITPGNTGLLVGSGASVAQNLTNNTITNNIIRGANTSDNNGNITLNFYNCAIACFDNGIITSNDVNGAISSNTSIMVYFGRNGNIIVRNNSFSRDGQTIEAYVSGPGGPTTGAVEITDNFFDSDHYDDSNPNTTENTNNGFISSNWTFERNVNQIGYISINARSLIPNGGNTAAYTIAPVPLANAYMNINFTNTIDTPFVATAALNTIIPDNTQLLQVVLGTVLTSGATTIDTAALNNFGFFLGQQFYSGFNLISPPSGLVSSLANAFYAFGDVTSTTIPNPYNSSTNYVTINSTNADAWAGSPTPQSLFAYLDVSGNSLYSNRGNSLDFFFLLTVTTNGSQTASIQLSPILLKYKW